jgi:hypothetical protein
MGRHTATTLDAMRPIMLAALLIATLGQPACAPSESHAGASADTLVVREERRITSFNGIEWGDLTGLVADAQGRFAVVDPTLGVVVRFTPDGEVDHTFGALGRGPGELRSARGLRNGPDGSYWIRDDVNGRFVVFNADGEFARNVPRRSPFGGAAWVGGVLADGRLVDDGVILDPAAPRGRPPPGLAVSPATRMLIRRHPDSAAVDTILREPAPARYLRYTRGASDIPFGNRWLAVIDARGRLWTAETAGNAIHRIGPHAADTVLTVVSTPPPSNASRAARAAIADSLAAFLGAGPGVDAVPEVVPAFDHFFVDDRDRLWVRIVRDDEVLSIVAFNDEGGRWTPPPPASAFYHVYRPDGALMAVATVPFSPDAGYRATHPPVVTGDRFVALVRNADGIVSVAVGRLTP